MQCSWELPKKGQKPWKYVRNNVNYKVYEYMTENANNPDKKKESCYFFFYLGNYAVILAVQCGK
jgi:hypothetical protein